MGEVENLKEKLKKCEYAVAELADKNELLESQIESLEAQIEDLSVQLDDCENGTNNAGFIDPVSDDEDCDISFQELCARQQEELNSLLEDLRVAVEQRDAAIDAFEEIPRLKDSAIDDMKGTITSMENTIKTQKEIIKTQEEFIKGKDGHIEVLERNQTTMAEIFPVMQSRIDERDIQLLIYRDKMTEAEAIAAFAKANNRPIKEVEKMYENIDS